MNVNIMPVGNYASLPAETNISQSDQNRPDQAQQVEQPKRNTDTIEISAKAKELVKTEMNGSRAQELNESLSKQAIEIEVKKPVYQQTTTSRIDIVA